MSFKNDKNKGGRRAREPWKGRDSGGLPRTEPPSRERAPLKAASVERDRSEKEASGRTRSRMRAADDDLRRLSRASLAWTSALDKRPSTSRGLLFRPTVRVPRTQPSATPVRGREARSWAATHPPHSHHRQASAVSAFPALPLTGGPLLPEPELLRHPHPHPHPPAGHEVECSGPKN